jgi:uncharacterized protein GlcG (DUF336 family)
VSVDLETARRIIEGVLRSAKDRQLQPLTVVVLDSGAHLVAAERQDGSSIKRFEVAFGKAHGALALGMGSRGLMARAEQQPYFVAAVTAAIGGSLIPVPGGVLIRDADNHILGAVGVSGDLSDNDEAVAIDAVGEAGLTADGG